MSPCIVWDGFPIIHEKDTLRGHGAGTPSVSEEEEPEFVRYMNECTKVELVARVLQMARFKEERDSSRKELVRGSGVGCHEKQHEVFLLSQHIVSRSVSLVSCAWKGSMSSSARSFVLTRWD